MAFNIGLSGLRGAQADLETTGNNIANASTVGFKKSRVEFGDLFSNSFFTSGAGQVGDGVRVQDVRQQFSQGNISNTDSNLDLAINGEGFFILDNQGETRFSRAGQFGVDQEGFIVNNQSMRVQGFDADENGNLGGILGDVQVDTQNLPPRRTTNVVSELTLDAREPVLAERFTTFTADGNLVGTLQAGIPASLPAETWDITDPNGIVSTFNTTAGSAGSIAAQISQQDGFSVSATSTATLDGASFNPDANDQLTLNGVTFNLTGGGTAGLQDLADDINGSSLVGVSAVVDSGVMTVSSSNGDNLEFDYNPGGTGSIDVSAPNTATPFTLDTANPEVSVLGTLDFRLSEGFSIDATGTPTDIVDDPTLNQTVTNLFDPDDPATFNHATSTTIFDSLGNPHEMTQFFVKESATGPNPTNLWTMYVQIDGEDVGPPSAVDGTPTRAAFSLRFNNDGSLDEALSDEILISNWTPLGPDGNPNGADGPDPNGTLPIPEPPVSSNFAIDMSQTNQFGSDFAVNDLQQNGFTTGRLTGLDVSGEGILFARFSNGQSSVLGQVALANFRNPQGLAPVGETTWVESFDSGDPIVGPPDSGPLGSITASAVEESNVDLSEQLVNLIVAQRNFQANAQTIETADTTTQTIINI